MIKDILTKNGYNVAGEAENGMKAVEKFKEVNPDLVLMDITMPEMDGIQALKEIKKLDGGAKVIMCSAMGQQAMVIESIQAGAKDFIVKPFQAERVIEKGSGLMIILTGKADSYAQFITVLFIFVAVLAVTALVTKWIAGYQKQQGAAGNIEVRETVRIANNKYIQLVRIGESYFAIAVCKDTVTALGQIPAEQLKGKTTLESTSGFRELLERAAKKENEEKDH